GQVLASADGLDAGRPQVCQGVARGLVGTVPPPLAAVFGVVGGDGEHVEAGVRETLERARRANQVHRLRARRGRADVGESAVLAVGIAASVTGTRPQPAAHKVIASGSEARRGARPILAVLGAFDYPPVWPGAALRDGAARSARPRAASQPASRSPR